MSRKIEREIEFTDWWFKEHHKAPTYADAIEWAERTMIDKACEWIDSNARHYLDATGNCVWFDSVRFRNDFRKAMRHESKTKE